MEQMMNQRIEELAKQCTTLRGDGYGYYNESFDKAKFAELIIRECVKAVSFSYKNEDYDSEWDAALREAESNVKQHFGVE